MNASTGMRLSRSGLLNSWRSCGRRSGSELASVGDREPQRSSRSRGTWTPLLVLFVASHAQAKAHECNLGHTSFEIGGHLAALWPDDGSLGRFNQPAQVNRLQETIRYDYGGEGNLQAGVRVEMPVMVRHQPEACGLLIELLTPGALPALGGAVELPAKTIIWVRIRGYTRAHSRLRQA